MLLLSGNWWKPPAASITPRFFGIDFGKRLKLIAKKKKRREKRTTYEAIKSITGYKKKKKSSKHLCFLP